MKGNNTWNLRNITPGQRKLWCTEIRFWWQDTSQHKPRALHCRCPYQENGAPYLDCLSCAVTGYHDGGCELIKCMHWKNGSCAKEDLGNAEMQVASFPFLNRTYLKDSLSWRYHEISQWKCFFNKSNLSSRGGLKF